MLCNFCGMERATATICPICQRSNDIITIIKEIKPFSGDLKPVRYECPLCGGRTVQETVAHENGMLTFAYDLDAKQASNQDQWNKLKGVRIVDTRCGCCEMPLSKDDQLNFFEETESWL